MARAGKHKKWAAACCVGLAALCAGPAWASDVTTLPSGHEARLAEVIWGTPGPSGQTVRFRFIDEALGNRVAREGFVDAEADMAHLCAAVAVPEIGQSAQAPGQIIISISDRYLPLGEADPEAVQLFEAYRLEAGACVWEGF